MTLNFSEQLETTELSDLFKLLTCIIKQTKEHVTTHWVPLGGFALTSSAVFSPAAARRLGGRRRGHHGDL